MTIADEQAHVLELAREALPLWPVPQAARVTFLNLSENTTCLVSAPGWRAVLRVHRDGYNCREAIEQELDWARALGREGLVKTPRPIAGVNGDLVQQARSTRLPDGRFMVMFTHVAGRHPHEDDDLTIPFGQLGAMAARMHLHAQAWPHPSARLCWDEAAIFGPRPLWGDWRDAPGVSATIRAMLERTEAVIRQRLAAFGKPPTRYGLIHADMRLANLLVDRDTTWLIDFDDCGTGWFLYDFAASISFIEDHPQIPDLRRAWVTNYRRFRPLSDEEEQEIDTFVMLRRMALLAWIGSHAEAPEPQAMAPHFAKGSARLAARYLSRFDS